MQVTLLLHNIRSVHNVGSMFRTAECAGVREIILSGYTPTPLDRFGNKRKDFAKVSLGTEDVISWKKVVTPQRTLKELRSTYTILALEQDPRSIPVRKYQKHPQKLVLMVGNEVRGLSSALRREAQDILEIPLRGKKESLNVSVALGIALFSLLDLS